MQIDPRLLKQIIQLQLVNNMDLSGTALNSTTTSTTNNDTFQMLLNEYLHNNAGNASLNTSNLSLDMLSSVYPSVMDALQLNSEGSLDLGSVSTGGTQPSLSSSPATIPTAYDDIIRDASQKYGISELLIKALIKEESEFQPNVVSSAGAKGLMQLMDVTAASMGVTNSFDPEQNIHGGTRFLGYLMKKYDGQEKVALAAYGCGPTRLAKLGIQTEQDLMEKLHLLPQETQNYLKKIERAKQQVTLAV